MHVLLQLYHSFTFRHCGSFVARTLPKSWGYPLRPASTAFLRRRPTFEPLSFGRRSTAWSRCICFLARLLWDMEKHFSVWASSWSRTELPLCTAEPVLRGSTYGMALSVCSLKRSGNSLIWRFSHNKWCLYAWLSLQNLHCLFVIKSNIIICYSTNIRRSTFLGVSLRHTMLKYLKAAQALFSWNATASVYDHIDPASCQ